MPLKKPTLPPKTGRAIAWQHRAHAAWRELGCGLALLALWLLTLLLPYHQTAPVLQLLAQSGHEVAAEWSICASIAQNDRQDAGTPGPCPMQAVGKDSLISPPPSFDHIRQSTSYQNAAVIVFTAWANPSGIRPHDYQPRAPPRPKQA